MKTFRRTILKPVGRLTKVNPNSEENSKGLVACLCHEVDINNPLKLKIKYIRYGCLYECFVDYENITNLCYGLGVKTIYLMLAYLTLKAWSFLV